MGAHELHTKVKKEVRTKKYKHKCMCKANTEKTLQKSDLSMWTGVKFNIKRFLPYLQLSAWTSDTREGMGKKRLIHSKQYLLFLLSVLTNFSDSHKVFRNS